MNAEKLIELYDRVAEAPDAIPRLRRFVLDLAVRGKLVEQDGGERAPTVPVHGESVAAPFTTPDSWRWVRIVDQLDLLNGIAFKPTDWRDSGLRIVRIQNLNNLDAPFNHCEPAQARERSLIDDGAFLISWSGTPGTSFGAFIWNRGPAVLNQHIFRCDFKTDSFTPGFLRLAINGRLDEMIAKAHGGVGLQHITKGKLESLLIPLPPLAEQHRIVARVDELMALLDRLDAARSAREATRDRFTTASLTRLTAPDPDTRAADAQSTLDALHALTTRTGQIRQLRQTIIDLAVKGRLAAQNHADVPAIELLRQTGKKGSDKLRLRAVGGSSINTSRDRFQPTMPTGWALASLSELGPTQTGTSPSSSRPELLGDFLPFIKPGDLGGKSINYGGQGLSREGALSARIAPANSVLMVCIGATLGKVGVTARDVSFNQQINSITPSVPEMTRFVALALRSTQFQASAWSKAGTGTLPIISKGKWEMLMIPVPPLAEQHRIVAKVDELMALCDRLEAALSTADITRARLLETLLHEALAPGSMAQEAA